LLGDVRSRASRRGLRGATFAAAAIAAAGLVACNALLDLGAYHVDEADGAAPGGGGDGGLAGPCAPDAAPNDAGCYECAPQNDKQLLNACTKAQCVTFDDARLAKLIPADGKLPAYPANGPFDAGPILNPDAGAVPNCAAINSSPVVYVTGTAKPFVSSLASALFAAPDPITIVYVGRTSCVGVDAILNSTATPPGTVASYFDSGGNEQKCVIGADDAGGPTFTQIGVSDVFATTCFQLPNGIPKDMSDFPGPVQSMTFAVPKASTQTAISANAAYFVYGFGGAAGLAPWTDDAFIYKRNPTSGTSQLIAPGIGVRVEDWKGIDSISSSTMITKLTSSTAPEKTIGVVADTDITDTLTQKIGVLAFKYQGQSCAYYPDSTQTAKDKNNTRDGHYALWGPFHFFAKIDTGGNIRDAAASKVINYLTGRTPPPNGLDLIQVEATLNLVPLCAMHVTRSTEMGPLTPAAPPNACGCKFEQIATGHTDCKACKVSGDCPSDKPTCSFGYCEPQ